MGCGIEISCTQTLFSQKKMLEGINGWVSSLVNHPYPYLWFRFKHVEPVSFIPNLFSFDNSSLNDLTGIPLLTYQQQI